MKKLQIAFLCTTLTLSNPGFSSSLGRKTAKIAGFFVAVTGVFFAGYRLFYRYENHDLEIGATKDLITPKVVSNSARTSATEPKFPFKSMPFELQEKIAEDLLRRELVSPTSILTLNPKFKGLVHNSFKTKTYFETYYNIDLWIYEFIHEEINQEKESNHLLRALDVKAALFDTLMMQKESKLVTWEDWERHIVSAVTAWSAFSKTAEELSQSIALETLEKLTGIHNPYSFFFSRSLDQSTVASALNNFLYRFSWEIADDILITRSSKQSFPERSTIIDELVSSLPDRLSPLSNLEPNLPLFCCNSFKQILNRLSETVVWWMLLEPNKKLLDGFYNTAYQKTLEPNYKREGIKYDDIFSYRGWEDLASRNLHASIASPSGNWDEQDRIHSYRYKFVRPLTDYLQKTYLKLQISYPKHLRRRFH